MYSYTVSHLTIFPHTFKN